MSMSVLSDRFPAKDLGEFDRRSGSWLERLLFGHRPLIVTLCILITLVLGWSSRNIEFNSSFDSLIPVSHPFIRNYLDHRSDVGGLGNVLRVTVESKHGDIFGAAYINTLRDINDRVFLLPGVDRGFMKSLWTSNTTWVAVTEDGLAGGPVMPDNFDGSDASLAQLRTNVERSSEIGQLVATDFKSSIILVPLLDVDQATGKPLNYGALSAQLELIRAKYEKDGIEIHVTGFAKIMGDLIQALHLILTFFAISVLIAAAMVFLYTRCVRSTVIVVICSLIAIVWQIGLLPLLHFSLDPYSILVPFLVFAIGMSHGAQKMNGVMQDIGRGTHRLVAARLTFRRLFIAGLTALVCDAVGFAVLLVIDIPAIRELAVIASIGVAILTFTNLILLPIILSYVGVSKTAALRSGRAEARATAEGRRHPLWNALDAFTRPGYATAALLIAVALGAWGYYEGLQLHVGDLDPGAPELRPESRYNRDNAYLVHHYTASSDVFAAMVTTPPSECSNYETLADMDELEQRLRRLPGVEHTDSLADFSRQVSTALNEGSLSWYEIVPNQEALNEGYARATRDLVNQDCSLDTVYVYLRDHKAETLSRVVTEIEQFSRERNTPNAKFLLAAGNSGIEAATNIVVSSASSTMLYYVYAAVILLSLVTFRSFGAVLAAVLPLVLTSILARALMVHLGIGVKVATLPVTALGVGIGVDYSLYILSVMLVHLRAGQTLSTAYYRALLFTGKVVMLTGFTLAAAVVTWAYSPIKFQADMGILLAFMFLLNMAGALILLPALAYFLIVPGHSRRVVYE